MVFTLSAAGLWTPPTLSGGAGVGWVKSSDSSKSPAAGHVDQSRLTVTNFKDCIFSRNSTLRTFELIPFVTSAHLTYCSWDRLNGEQSDLLRVTCGVPQGSVLGPKLFHLYIHGICHVFRLLHVVWFADGTNLLYASLDPLQLLDIMEKELATLKRWFGFHKLSLNAYKIEGGIFGNRKTPNEIHIFTDNTVKMHF